MDLFQVLDAVALAIEECRSVWLHPDVERDELVVDGGIGNWQRWQQRVKPALLWSGAQVDEVPSSSPKFMATWRHLTRAPDSSSPQRAEIEIVPRRTQRQG